MFGKAFASKPDQFQFLPGNRTVIEVIYEISKNLVDAPKKTNVIDFFNRSDNNFPVPNFNSKCYQYCRKRGLLILVRI